MGLRRGDGINELIVRGGPRSFGTSPGWLRNQLTNQASELSIDYYYDLGEFLAQHGVNVTEALMSLPSYHLIKVPDGDTFSAIARLFRTFGDPGLPEPIEVIEPNFQMQLSQLSTRIGSNFKLNGKHGSYKLALNVSSSSTSTGKDVNVAVIDTGAEQTTFTKTFIDLFESGNTLNKDGWGHGSAMVEIIHDIAPDAKIHAIRISDVGSVRLMDLTAGIITAAHDPRVMAHIISLSLGCASMAGVCAACGSSGTNRSTTLEHLLRSISAGNNVVDPVFVCAVGNDPKIPGSGFDWPARYDCTLAVGSINEAKQASTFSKRGTRKADYVMCPGGDYDTQNGTINEWVGEGDHNGTVTKCAGTSPAAAYGSGLLALYRQKFLHDLRAAGRPVKISSRELLDGAYAHNRCVISDIQSYSSYDHGKGRLVYDDSRPYP